MVDPGPEVFVVDGDQAYRDGVVRLLGANGVEAVGHGSAEDLLAAGLSSRPGCVLIDVILPGMSGLALFRQLRRNHPSYPVIFLTRHGDIRTAVRTIKSGAFDFLSKPVDEEVLLGTVWRALAENRRRRRALQACERARALLATLTPRERDVLRHLARGATNKQVGQALGIAEKTVKCHRGSLRGKLGVASAVEMVKIVRLAGDVAGDRGANASLR
jgi:FixJ family two-component response regulator